MQMKKNIWLCIPIKSGLLILCFLFSNHLIFSQQIEWIKQINYIWNTLYADESPVLNIETDSAGNVYAAGKCRIPYFNGYASDYHRGFFLEKRDSNGNILWMDTVVQQADLVSLAFDGSNLSLRSANTKSIKKCTDQFLSIAPKMLPGKLFRQIKN